MRKKIFTLFCILLLLILTSACSSSLFNPDKNLKNTKNLQLPKEKPYQIIYASYYGGKDGFNGRRTANGEKFCCTKLTAAHRSLPFGTILKVTNPENGKSVDVRINDRGPYIKGRSLDLSLEAAKRIGLTKQGIGIVHIAQK